LDRAEGYLSRVDGPGRITVELPASGTMYRAFDNSVAVSWTPDLAPDELQDRVLQFFDDDYPDRLGAIRFAPFDF
jgi:hypothetical protein